MVSWPAPKELGSGRSASLHSYLALLSFTFPMEGKWSGATRAKWSEETRTKRQERRDKSEAKVSLEKKVIKLSNKEKKKIRKDLVS